MRRGLALVAILCLVVTGSALAHPSSDVMNVSQAPRPGEMVNDLPATSVSHVRADTVWFGGYNEAGDQEAYNSYDDGGEAVAIWTWDAGTTDPLEGWTTIDVSENLDDYFSRMTTALFEEHPDDPAVPMFPGEVGQIWVGAHADEADDLGWRLGMGYGNNWRQKAVSPKYPFSAGQEVDVAFKYFQDSEVDFDYTYVHVVAYAGVDTEVYEFARLHMREGTYQVPANFVTEAPITYETFTEIVPTEVQLELFFFADGGWSDEDGDYACDYGPFAADDIAFTVGTTTYDYDFETDEDGWTFFKVPGIGAFMDVVDEVTWESYVYTTPGMVACPCNLSGNALWCATSIPTNPRPGHPRGQNEQMHTPVIDRESYTTEAGWFNVVAEWDFWVWMRISSGTFYRPGFKYYPFISALNPTPRWSPRFGQNVWHYTGESSECRHGNQASLTVPTDGTPLPYNWEQMKFIMQVTCDCAGFGLTGPTDCKKEGITKGSPVYDNVRVGLTGGVNAPGIVLQTGHLFHDGFGQKVPTYLDPGDVCNSDIAYDLSRDNVDLNDWYGDTAIVNGPPVTLPAYQYWIDLCVKVAQKGPRQDMIPAYSAWKARFTGDPEVDFVCALMDSAMTMEGGELIPKNEGQVRVTFFHEDDGGFDPNFDRGTPEQEILPDEVFTPGTRIEYYYRSYWSGGVIDYFTIPGNAPAENVNEMEFLPMMVANDATPELDYDVIWPCVLYVDAYNRGGETYITPTLDQLGYDYDKFDRQNFSSNYDAPFMRSFGGDYYNPGGYGNNGCTLEQLLGYRLILWNTGTLGIGGGEEADFIILDQWLTTTECGLSDIRRGLIMNGDEITELMADDEEGKAILFCTDVLGADILDHAYRDYNNDDDACVLLDSIIGGGEFDPVGPISLYDNGCPRVRNYNVITGVSSGVGNLQYQPTAGGDPVQYAQVAKEVLAGPGGAGGWKVSVDGFSWHHLSQVGYLGQTCSDDTLAIIAGCADLLGPELTWMAAGGAPFVAWHHPCEDVAVDETPDTHLSGPVDFLYQSRPNPFRGTAKIRFNLAGESPVDIAIYDVSGRVVRTLMDGKGNAGENTVEWNGLDNAGNHVGSGIFWVKMSTPSYESTKQMVVM
ncbi:MAG: T9SS type A sorting domain-containing protein [Candidatus Eisenbacteria sp.]|nr:T9SS type A sorting domain-containing protein [Candidatus Eisenbacteria bacterium]